MPETSNPQAARKEIRRKARWRFAVGLNVLFSLSLAILLAVLINGVSSRYYWRGDISSSGLYRLSNQTDQVLAALSGPVDIIVFFQRGEELFHDIENLLREYQYRSNLLRIEYVDPDRNLARTEELARLYDVKKPNVVVVHHAGRHRILGASDVMEYNFSGVRQGLAPTRTRFRGEQAFTSAIYAVTQARLPTVYMLSGHGERRLDNFDPYVGYSTIAKRMQRDNIQLQELILGETRAIPADADAVIIAGPTRRLTQPEQDLLHTYLDRSGRLLLLLDSKAQTGLEGLLMRWGVRIGDDVVIDLSRTFTGRELFLTDYGVHPITDRVRGTTSVFYSPRSIEPLPRPVATSYSDQADKPHVVVLASSSDSGWAEMDPDHTPLRFDAGIDRPGPVSVAVAAERGPVPGIDVQIRSTRMVVFGDSAFVANGGLTGGDEDFFMSALNWLLDREEMMAIAPRDVEQIKLVLTKRDIRRLLLWTMGAFPASVALFGMMVWIKRRQ